MGGSGDLLGKDSDDIDVSKPNVIAVDSEVKYDSNSKNSVLDAKSDFKNDNDNSMLSIELDSVHENSVKAADIIDDYDLAYDDHIKMNERKENDEIKTNLSYSSRKDSNFASLEKTLENLKMDLFSGDNDDFVMAALFTDEEKKKLKDERKKKQQELYIMKHGSVFKFLYLNGDIREIQVTDRPKTYADMQRVISQYTPNSLSMFICQYENGECIRPNGYVPVNTYVVREIYARTIIPTHFPKLENKWEFKTYQAKPLNWVDMYQEKKKKEKEMLAKKQEQERWLDNLKIDIEEENKKS